MPKENNTGKEDLTYEKAAVGSWGKLVRSRVNAVLRYSGKRILDVGCANGSYVRLLRKKGFEAYGIDLIENAAWNGPDKDLFQTADITRLPFKDGFFDTALAFEVLEHTKNIEQALKELYRVTGKNIIVSVPNCEHSRTFQLSGLAFHHWVDRTHEHFFTPALLREAIEKAGFSVLNERYINPIFPEFLIMRMWHMPFAIAWLISRACNLLPVRKKYYMTILLIARK